MKRRNFLKTSIAAASAGTLAGAFAADTGENTKTTSREFYDLRIYHLRRGPMQKRFDEFYKHAAIPAMNRAGMGPVGVFSVLFGPESPSMYALIPHKSAESFAGATDRLRADAEYLKAGAEFINAPATDPSYVRVENSLMRAFEGIPRIEVPAAAADTAEMPFWNKPRIFELRTYESHSKAANQKKIEMFNTGEIALFRRTGLQPVFFGETLVGSKMPNLTYMIAFENMAAHDKNWGAFIGDPEWKKMSSQPGYTDAEIVSNISNVFLKPTGYSQI